MKIEIRNDLKSILSILSILETLAKEQKQKHPSRKLGSKLILNLFDNRGFESKDKNLRRSFSSQLLPQL